MAESTAERIAELSRDAAYVTIGLGVIAFQQAQVRRRALVTELDKRTAGLKEQAEGLKGNTGGATTALGDTYRSLETTVGDLRISAQRFVRSIDLADVKLPELKRPDVKLSDLGLPEVHLGEVSGKVGERVGDVAKASRQAAEDAYAHVVDLVRRGHEQGVASVEAAEAEYEAEVTAPTEGSPKPPKSSAA
jgi:hypothetical protein